MTAAIPVPAPHPDDCDVCHGRNLVQVSVVRSVDGEATAAGPARIRPCPLLSGADILHALAAMDRLGRPLRDPGGAA